MANPLKINAELGAATFKFFGTENPVLNERSVMLTVQEGDDRCSSVLDVEADQARRMARNFDIVANYLDRVDERETQPCPKCEGRPYSAWAQGREACSECEGRGFVQANKGDSGA